jgi:predicted Zn-dependent protease
MLSISRTALFDPREALARISIDADWVGLRLVKTRESKRMARDGCPESNGVITSFGAMIEVLVDGQFGYGATNQLTLAGLQAAADSALQQAKASARRGLYSFSATVRPWVTGQYTSGVSTPIAQWSAHDLNEILTKLCYTLKVSDAIVQTHAAIVTTERETWLSSTDGCEVYQRQSSISTDFGATAKDGAITQRRSDGGWYARSYQGGLEWLDDRLWERAQRIGEEAVELLSAPECPTETTSLVLAPDQMMLQIHESVGHPLELDRILGDERNYAGGSFVRPEDFGQLQYGSPLMNITFDPSVPGELASYQFDDTGATAKRQYLIRNGKLERGLGSRESQLRSGVAGVACARSSSWNRAPIDRMANLNLEPGDRSFDEMIGSIERGILMRSNSSWSIDDQRYKFQFGCEYAQRIEDGRITQTLRNPNYRSTTNRFWQSLSQVGDRSTWEVFGTPSCGKGEPNQLIWVGHAAPVCVFDNIEVFGGG